MKQILSVLSMALVTYIPRVLPVSIFNREIKSKFLQSFLFYMPYAVLSSLTFPAIFYATDSLFSAIAGTAVAIVLAYFEKSLVIVAIGAICTAFAGSFLVLL